jgi:hypothetical protein
MKHSLITLDFTSAVLLVGILILANGSFWVICTSGLRLWCYPRREAWSPIALDHTSATTTNSKCINALYNSQEMART